MFPLYLIRWQVVNLSLNQFNKSHKFNNAILVFLNQKLVFVSPRILFLLDLWHSLNYPSNKNHPFRTFIMGVMSILQYSNKTLLSALNQLGNLDRYVKMTPNLTDGKNFNHFKQNCCSSNNPHNRLRIPHTSKRPKNERCRRNWLFQSHKSISMAFWSVKISRAVKRPYEWSWMGFQWGSHVYILPDRTVTLQRNKN